MLRKQEGSDITISIGEISFPDENYNHFATSWELSWSPDMEDTPNTPRNEKAIIISNYRDTKNLNDYTYHMDELTNEDIIYGRSKIHYTVKNPITQELQEYETRWSPPVDILGDQQNFKVSNTILATPRIHLEEDFIGNQEANLIFTTEPMEVFIGYGNHLSTSWSIETTDGKVIIAVDKAEDMKTKFIINSNKLDKNKIYIIKAIHHSDTNVKSLPGKYIYNNSVYKTDLYDVVIKGDLVLNRALGMEVILNVNTFEGIDICIKDKDGNIKVFQNDQKTLYPTILPTNLEPGKLYYIYARIKYNQNDKTDWKLIKSLRAKSNTFNNIDTFAKYNNKYTFMHPFIQFSNKYLRTRELYQGGFILPKSGDESKKFKGLCYYEIEADSLLYIKDIENITEEADNTNYLSNWGVDVIPLNNGNIVVSTSRIIVPTEDTLEDSKNNMLVFTTYRVNEPNNTFDKMHSLEVENQYKSTSVSGSACAIKNDIYYVPTEINYGKNKVHLSLFKYSSETNETEEVVKLPFEVHSFVSLCKLDDNKILILGGVNKDTEENKDLITGYYNRTNDNVYIYNVDTKTFDLILTLDERIDKKLYNFHVVLRKDGKVMLFNNSENPANCYDQSTILIDLTLKEYKTLNNDFKDNVTYLKTIECNNGNFLRISSNEYNPQMVYAYNIYGYNNISSTGEVVNNVITDLVVPENTTITVNNLYRYKSIKILGSVDAGTSGTLIWIDNDVIRKFDSNWKFIAKESIYYDDTQDGITRDGTPKNVFILGNVTIHIKEGLSPRESFIINKEETEVDTTIPETGSSQPRSTETESEPKAEEPSHSSNNEPVASEPNDASTHHTEE